MDNDKKHSLGSRAFFLFLSRKVKWTVIFVLFTLFCWYIERWLPIAYLPWAQEIVFLLWAFTVAIFAFTVFEAWLEYRYYTYTFTEEAFIMTYGYFLRIEMAAPYHQIQNVSIQRSILDRFIGVSQIVIFLTGSEQSGHNKLVLPAVGSKKAKLVQKELLVRARHHAG